MSEKDDNELVYEVIKGNIPSFEVLVDRYQKTIFNMVLKMAGDVETAKDITQDVFVTAFEKMDGFNFKYRFFSWIYRIAINRTLNNLKSKGPTERLNKVEMNIAEDITDQGQERNRKILQSGLKGLQADYRVLLLLKYYCGLSYKEISEAMKIPERKVKSRLFIAREQLHDIMVGKGFFEND